MDYQKIINDLQEMLDLKLKYRAKGEPEKSAICAIKELLSRAEEAEKRVEKAERERDAAIKDIKMIADEINKCEKTIIQDGEETKVCDLNLGRCSACIHGNDCDFRIDCDFQWRGLKEE